MRPTYAQHNATPQTATVVNNNASPAFVSRNTASTAPVIPNMQTNVQGTTQNMAANNPSAHARPPCGNPPGANHPGHHHRSNQQHMGGGSGSSSRPRGRPPGSSKAGSGSGHSSLTKPAVKKKKLADRVLPIDLTEFVPESEAYMELVSFEKKLDSTIMRKRLEIQEALKRPMKLKKKLRVMITTQMNVPPEAKDLEDKPVLQWEMRVEGKLLDDPQKQRRKFSTFFKSLIIELDREIYGPDNHLVEWHRSANTEETDGYQVKRPCEDSVKCKCTILLVLDHDPPQYKLDPRLARLLGVHTKSRPVIIEYFWEYVKTHKLQDHEEREYINCDKYLEQIFECKRMKLCEFPIRLNPLLMAPDPIKITHIIDVSVQEPKKTNMFEIDVEIDDTLKDQMKTFLLSTQSQQDIQTHDVKIQENIQLIKTLKTNREFFLRYSEDPKQFITEFLASQSKDLKTMTNQMGNPEKERRADFYQDQSWLNEAVGRYIYSQVEGRRIELEQTLRS